MQTKRENGLVPFPRRAIPHHRRNMVHLLPAPEESPAGPLPPPYRRQHAPARLPAPRNIHKAIFVGHV